MPRTKSFNDLKKIAGIINKCDVCYVGMVKASGLPYVLPFNFAFCDNFIYLHSAPEGEKMDALAWQPNVSIAFSTDHSLRYSSEEVACSYGMKFKSVIAEGKVEMVDNLDEKQRILNLIMLKYTGKNFSFNYPAIKSVAVMRIKIEKFSGRESGY